MNLEGQRILVDFIINDGKVEKSKRTVQRITTDYGRGKVKTHTGDVHFIKPLAEPGNINGLVYQHEAVPVH